MSFSGVVIETAMNVTFPTLMAEFSVGTSTVQWMTTGYLLVLACVIPLSSFLKRRFPTKALFVCAMALFLTGVVVCALAPSFDVLLAGRLVQGVGTGVALPLMFNIVLEQSPLDRMGSMMGVASLITAAAPAVGRILDRFGARPPILLGKRPHRLCGVPVRDRGGEPLDSLVPRHLPRLRPGPRASRWGT
jgi:MFS family permease